MVLVCVAGLPELRQRSGPISGSSEYWQLSCWLNSDFMNARHTRIYKIGPDRENLTMSTRYNNGSHYENHQRAAELHDGAAHAHLVGEEHGKQDHLTGHEHSRMALEHSTAEAVPAGHGITEFGHRDIAALAHEYWQARGCPEGSPQEDWFRATKELRARNEGKA
jgi:hypothetical protein